MRAHHWALIAVVVLAAPGLALAQQAPGTGVDPQLRHTCRTAVLKICKPGFIPNRAAITRCAEDNKDKLPPQCAALITAQKRT